MELFVLPKQLILLNVGKVRTQPGHSLYLRHHRGRWGSPRISREAESLLPFVFSLSTQLLALVYIDIG